MINTFYAYGRSAPATVKKPPRLSRSDKRAIFARPTSVLDPQSFMETYIRMIEAQDVPDTEPQTQNDNFPATPNVIPNENKNWTGGHNMNSNQRKEN